MRRLSYVEILIIITNYVMVIVHIASANYLYAAYGFCIGTLCWLTFWNQRRADSAEREVQSLRYQIACYDWAGRR